MPLNLKAHEVALDEGLLEAARQGDPAEVAQLLDAGGSVDVATPTGDSLLILAALHDRPEIVDLLLERGADQAHRNDEGLTALMAATFRGSGRIVRSLLARDPEAEASIEATAAVADFWRMVTRPGRVVLDEA